jgi:hypothetical protein
MVVMDTKPKTQWFSIGILLLSIGGAALAALFGSITLLSALLGLMKKNAEAGRFQESAGFACTSLLVALILIIPAILAVFRLMGKPEPGWRLPEPDIWALAGLLFVPILIIAGYTAGLNRYSSAALMPLLQLGTVTLPLIWLLVMGRRKLPVPSRLHDWGLASFSLTVTIPFIIILEAIVVFVVVVITTVFIQMQHPDILKELTVTMNRLGNTGTDRESYLRILRPYIGQPAVIYFILSLTAGIVPLLEEMFKPLALWFFSNRPLTPREGLMGGMICGACFALVESLGTLMGIGAGTWVSVVIGRIGTGVLHVTASGLVGWGLAKAWSEGKYGSLAVSYLAAFCLHSLWNISALLTGFRELALSSSIMVNQMNGVVLASPFVLVMLTCIMVSIDLKANMELQKAERAKKD